MDKGERQSSREIVVEESPMIKKTGGKQKTTCMNDSSTFSPRQANSKNHHDPQLNRHVNSYQKVDQMRQEPQSNSKLSSQKKNKKIKKSFIPNIVGQQKKAKQATPSSEEYSGFLLGQPGSAANGYSAGGGDSCTKPTKSRGNQIAPEPFSEQASPDFKDQNMYDMQTGSMDTTPQKNFNTSQKTREAFGQSIEPLAEQVTPIYDDNRDGLLQNNKNQSIMISTEVV